MHENIFIFGDSISLGCFDAAGGWVRRLNSFLMERYISGDGEEILIYNLSISGNQSQDIAARFESESRLRLSEGENVVIFAIGVNDSAFVHSKNDFWVPFKEFKNNLQKLINLARKISDKIVFIGLPMIDQEIVDPMPWDTDKSYRNEYVKKYDKAIKLIVEENGMEYISIFEKFAVDDYKKLLFDGAHPNSDGHQLIFEVVRDYLLANKII